MVITQIESLITVLGGLLVLTAAGGAAWIGATELRLRAIRRGRLQGATQQTVAPARSRSGGGLGGQLVAGVRRLGQQDAVRDPAKLSVLRNQLMQAGFYNREAPVIYLGCRAIALVLATVGV